ncbi:T9SS type B sorting domain-containing protein [Aestuariivivens marinum]|uniref:T9SS type B sorting domain-containing protein n=1 Tax=Aestuariivivens marinum TaxID=2913555 RepID=UPI001F57BEDF|nr:T9SS type B sorting domain-containing protein [Aestuariivivens marinum]
MLKFTIKGYLFFCTVMLLSTVRLLAFQLIEPPFTQKYNSNPIVSNLTDFDGDGIDDSIDLDDDNDGIPDAIECGEVYCGENIVNGSFEQPTVSNGTWMLFHENNVPGWKTTASDKQIELWKSGFLGAPSADGNQHAELNANQVAALYQELCISGGSKVQWEVKHRGRDGVDVAEVKIGADLTSAEVVETMTDGTGSWGSYSGTYDVPDGQDTTFFIFESKSTSSGSTSSGNLIDDIVITILSEPICTTDFDGDGIPNSLDLDSDNDGIYDVVESGNGHLDSNNDGIIDDADINSGTNGLFNDIETIVDNGVITYTVLDSDSDGEIDALELDSDNDGCFDVVEAGHNDSDNNGLLGTDPVNTDVYGVVTSGSNGYNTPLDGDANDVSDFQETGNNLSIVNQPIKQGNCKGETIIFEVLPQEPDVTSYQWEVNTGSGWTSVIDNSNYSGSNSSQLQITNTPPNFTGHIYRVVLSHLAFLCDPGLVSNEVTLTVYDTPEPTGNSIQQFCDTDKACIADLIVSGTDILWYDAPNGGNLLNTSNILVNNTIYYATQTLNNCESQTRMAVTAEVYETIVALPFTDIPPIEVCDTLESGSDTDGIASFNLRERESLLLNGKNAVDYNFRYFINDTRTNEITGTDVLAFNNTSNTQTIFVRIENVGRIDCYTDVEFEIKVNPKPIINTVVQLTQCDDDLDGKAPFNLTEANQLISINHLNETFIYYTNAADAEVGGTTGRITNNTQSPNPETQFINPIAFSGSSVFARVETSNFCHRVAEVQLLVGASNIPSGFLLEYFECDTEVDDNDDTNGITNFNFSDAEQQIEAMFSNNVQVTFYTSLEDAQAEINAISNISNHRNDYTNNNFPNTQNIYVRVDSEIVNACEGLGHHITLHVKSLPETQSITDYPLCSETNTATFDLGIKDAEAIGTQTKSILVTYHETLIEAQDPIGFPAGLPKTNYLSNSRTIYVRTLFDNNNNGQPDTDECFNTHMTFDLIVEPNPIILQPNPIHICSKQIDTEYDLTLREDQITNNDISIQLEYYDSTNNLINNPKAYLSTQLNNTVIVLATGANGCTKSVFLELKTTIYANINDMPDPIEECEIDNNGFDNFDVRRREADILNGLDLSNFDPLTYYELETDAIDGNSNFIQDPSNFTNTTQDIQTIFVRVTPIDSECYQIVELTLIVNPVPEIDIEDEYVICLNNNNQSIPPQLLTTLPNPPIDTQLDISDYSFQWYNGTEAEAIDNPIDTQIVGATDSSFIPTEAGQYTVIATNRTTGCTIPATTEVTGSYPPENIAVELSSDAFSGNNILNITVVGNGSYEYRLDTTDWQLNPRFENVRGGERIIYARDIYNCNDISTFQIVLDYPKFFTPNGDGVNDIWNIRGIDTQPNAKIYIYDRYGKLLKQLTPKSLGWDGTFNGNPMPTNAYWFTIEYNEPKDNTIRVFKAHFTLKR